jgi:prepilin-type processing-associated H-X9-DG protein
LKRAKDGRKKEKKRNKLLLITAGLFICIFIVMVISPMFLPYKPPEIIVCNVHVRFLGLCCQIYHQDNEIWPNKDNWCNSLQPYFEDEDKKNWMCPANKIGPCSYAMNENIPADANELPGDLVLLFESAPGWNQTVGADDVVTDRHKRPGANIAFADGHVEFVKPDGIPTLRWTVEQKRGAEATR